MLGTTRLSRRTRSGPIIDRTRRMISHLHYSDRGIVVIISVQTESIGLRVDPKSAKPTATFFVDYVMGLKRAAEAGAKRSEVGTVDRVVGVEVEGIVRSGRAEGRTEGGEVGAVNGAVGIRVPEETAKVWII